MHPSIIRLRTLLAPLAAVVLAAPLAAQQQPTASGASQKPTVFDVTPYAGYMHFGNIINGPLGTSLRSANAPIIGAQLGIALGPNVGLVGNVAYGSSNLEIGVPIIGGVSVGGSSKHLMYDGDMELRMPMQSSGAAQTLTPFAQIGVGAITTKFEESVLSTSSTHFAGNAGAGIDVAFGHGFGARAMVKDYVGKFDALDNTGLPVSGKTTNNVMGSVGLRLSF
jgi:hypothetical protein